MMVKTKKSALQQRIEEENARESSRYEAPKAPGGGTLPAGIQGGVMKLVKIDWNEITEGDHRGAQRFWFQGVVVSPKEFKGEDIEGRFVSLPPIPLTDTTSEFGDKSFKENMSKAENRLKLLGFPTQDFDDIESESLEYMDANQESMFVEFSTWQPPGRDTPTVTVRRALPDYEMTHEDDVQDDSEAEEAPVVSRKQLANPKTAAKTAAKPAVTKITKPPAASVSTVSKGKIKAVEPEEETEEEEEEESLASLSKRADKGDKKAQRQISDKALESGINPEDPEYDNWTAVAEAIESSAKPKAKGKAVTKPKAKVVEAEPEEEEEGTTEPEKNGLVNYRPKGSKKLVECEITKVYKKDQTVNLRALTSEEEYDDVSWDDLIEIVA